MHFTIVAREVARCCALEHRQVTDNTCRLMQLRVCKIDRLILTSRCKFYNDKLCSEMSLGIFVSKATDWTVACEQYWGLMVGKGF